MGCHLVITKFYNDYMTLTTCGCDRFEPNAETWRGRPIGLGAGAGWSESTGFLGRPTGRLGSASGSGLDFAGRPRFRLGASEDVLANVSPICPSPVSSSCGMIVLGRFGAMARKCTVSNTDH